MNPNEKHVEEQDCEPEERYPDEAQQERPEPPDTRSKYKRGRRWWDDRS